MTHIDDDNVHSDDRELLELLKDYPMPEATADFYDQALARATHEGTRRQRNRWMLAGFGSAVAAGLAIVLIATQLLTTPDISNPDATIPGVTMALAEPQTVNLVFSSAVALEGATLTVSLPAGVELEGFPGQSEISWETSLSEGRNLLPLRLIAVSPAGGEVMARLQHENRNRTFRLRVQVG